MWKIVTRWAAVGLTSFWAVACTPSISSNAVDHYTGTIRRMLIVANVDPDPAKAGQIADGMMGMVGGIVRELARCGIRAEAKALRRVDAPAVAAYISSLPTDRTYDAVLRLRPAGLIMSGRFLMGENFEAVVTEAPSGQALFRARFSADRPISGDAVSATLIKRLTRDGILRSCKGVFAMTHDQVAG